MPKAKKAFQDCTVVRTVFRTYGTLNIETGAKIEDRKAWETEPCGTPLFSDEERAKGVCSSCAKGWNHPENYRADGPRPDKEING